MSGTDKRPPPSPSISQGQRPPQRRKMDETNDDELNRIDKIIVQAVEDRIYAGLNVSPFVLLGIIARHCEQVNSDLTDVVACHDFLDCNAGLKTKLNAAMIARSFKEILQMCACFHSCPLILLTKVFPTV